MTIHARSTDGRWLPSTGRKWKAPPVDFEARTRIIEKRIKLILDDLDLIHPLNTKAIIEITARHFRLSRDQIMTRHKFYRVCNARQVAMTITRIKFAGTNRGKWAAIGRRFQRDHSSAIAAYRKYNEVVARVVAAREQRKLPSPVLECVHHA